jgi:hypothetical protein
LHKFAICIVANINFAVSRQEREPRAVAIVAVLVVASRVTSVARYFKEWWLLAFNFEGK